MLAHQRPVWWKKQSPSERQQQWPRKNRISLESLVGGFNLSETYYSNWIISPEGWKYKIFETTTQNCFPAPFANTLFFFPKKTWQCHFDVWKVWDDDWCSLMYLELENWLFQFHDEPNLYIGNGWKSPNSKHPFLTGCSGFQLETQQLDLRFRPNDRGAHQQQCPGRYQPRLSKDFLRKKKTFFFAKLQRRWVERSRSNFSCCFICTNWRMSNTGCVLCKYLHNS